VLEKKVAVPSLLKIDCNSEPYLITTLVVFLLHLCAGAKSSSSFIVENRLQECAIPNYNISSVSVAPMSRRKK
jgi:hypothetical protein